MNSNLYLPSGLTAILAISMCSSAFAESGMLGKMSADEFKGSNKTAAEKVKAVAVAPGKFSDEDAELLKEVALGGMMQMEISKVAAEKATSEDVKMIAAAEVEEQMLVAAKVKELAAAGEVELPTTPDDNTKEMVEELKKESALELDKKYLKESGIAGHKKLKAKMEEVQKDATNAGLKALADATLPIINTHLKIATDESDDMK